MPIPAPPTPTEHVETLGQPVMTLRRSLTYSIIGCICAALLLSIVVLGFKHDYWESPKALAITFALLAGLFAFLISQRYAWLVLHEYGLRLVTLRKQQVLLWTDIASLAPTYSYLAHVNTIIYLVIAKRSGGKIVLRNNWIPHDDFTSLMTLFLSPTSTLLGGSGRLRKMDEHERSAPEVLSSPRNTLFLLLCVLGPLLLPAVLFTAFTSNVGLGNLPGTLKAPAAFGIIAVAVWLFFRTK